MHDPWRYIYMYCDVLSMYIAHMHAKGSKNLSRQSQKRESTGKCNYGRLDQLALTYLLPMLRGTCIITGSA